MSELFNEVDPDDLELAAMEDSTAFTIALTDRAIEQAEQRGMMAGFEAAQGMMAPLVQQTTTNTVYNAQQLLKETYARQGIQLTEDDLKGAGEVIGRNLVKIDDALTDPAQLAGRLDAAVALYRGEKAAKDREESWERIRRAPGLSYSDLMKPRPRGDGA